MRRPAYLVHKNGWTAWYWFLGQNYRKRVDYQGDLLKRLDRRRPMYRKVVRGSDRHCQRHEPAMPDAERVAANLKPD